MKALRAFFARLGGVFKKDRQDRELLDEIESHLQLHIADNVRAGMDPQRARRDALLKFGAVESVKEDYRDRRTLPWLETFVKDLTYTGRTLLRNPGFTTVAVLTLALGIGANAAIFTVVDAVLLKPLAYKEPETLVTVLHEGQGPISPADFLDFRAESRSFDGMAAAEIWGGILSGERAEAVSGIRFGEGMFELLGVPPLLGRTFQADDFNGENRVLVLGNSLWQRRFGGNPNIVGQELLLSGQSYTVVGVMPPQFRFAPFWATKAELAAPLDLRERAASRGGQSLRIFARLKPDVSLGQAQAEMDGICKRLEAAYPDSNTGRTVEVKPLLEQVVGNIRQALLVLSGAVVFVLLIACANVANLLLVRATARQKEIAIRTALGATRWRTVRQLLTESLGLAVVAGVVGLLFGYLSIAWIKSLMSGEASSFRLRMPRLAEISLDSTTLLFTLGVAVLAGLVFGLAPAVHAVRRNLHGGLRQAGAGTVALNGRSRLRSMLVVAEISLALITLVGAGLMLRSFTRLSAVDPGFNPHNVLALDLSLQGQPDMIGQRREAFYRELRERIQALPGVISMGSVNHLPLAGDVWTLGLNIEGRALPKPGEEVDAAYRVCQPGYFRTMQIRLVRGRDFSEQDRADGQAVAIINQNLADEQWPGEDPVGKRVAFDEPRSTPKLRTIVGVVSNVKQSSWTGEADNEIYLPFSQSSYFSSDAPHLSGMTVLVRTEGEPSRIAAGVRDMVWGLNRQVPVSNIKTLEEVIADCVWQPRFNLVLIGLFGGLALLLGAVGIYGVMAYAVTQRTNEIGIRVALGAKKTDVLGLVLRDGMKLAGIGILLGLGGAFALTRVLTDLLYEVKPADPLTFLIVSLFLAAVALVACWIPARRAANVNPVIALRQE